MLAFKQNQREVKSVQSLEGNKRTYIWMHEGAARLATLCEWACWEETYDSHQVLTLTQRVLWWVNTRTAWDSDPLRVYNVSMTIYDLNGNVRRGSHKHLNRSSDQLGFYNTILQGLRYQTRVFNYYSSRESFLNELRRHMEHGIIIVFIIITVIVIIFTTADQRSHLSPMIFSSIQPSHNRSPLALLNVLFIIDDGSLITFMGRSIGLILCIVTEVLSKPPPRNSLAILMVLHECRRRKAIMAIELSVSGISLQVIHINDSLHKGNERAQAEIMITSGFLIEKLSTGLGEEAFD